MHFFQAITVLKQVVAGLAVAEAALMFEHRDLHWGNILVQECDSDEHVQCFINGTRHDIATNGIKVRIIDFTLSRMTKGNATMAKILFCCVVFLRTNCCVLFGCPQLLRDRNFKT